ncbi:MAG: YraN family protein [bacterium]|nr:YraN family protein [bacterium]
MGDIGENIACDFLKKRGFEIIERNYSKKWGEIDIITKKLGLIHFIEVKSVTHARPLMPERSDGGRGTSDFRPEDNMHPWKLKRLSRAMQTYLLDRKLDGDWQLDLVTVKIDLENRNARVEIIENIII